MTTFCYFSSGKISSIVTGLFMTLMVWLYSGPSYSTPPSPPGKIVWFYRVDTRPPEIIFSEGFSPRGTNLNLVEHFLSMTAELRRTGFISVTDDYRTAVEFANNILGARNTDLVYIYQVSAEAGFYNVEYSIRMHLEDILFDRRETGDPLYNYLDRLYDGLEFFSWERAWVAAHVIPGNSVRSMSIVRRNPYPNPEYGDLSISVDEQSVPNPGFTASNSLGYLSAFPVSIPDQDVSSPGSSSTSSDHSADRHRNLSDSMGVPSISGYVSISMIYPACLDPSSQNKRSAENSGGCPLAKNLTKMRRDNIYISTILGNHY